MMARKGITLTNTIKVTALDRNCEIGDAFAVSEVWRSSQRNFIFFLGIIELTLISWKIDFHLSRWKVELGNVCNRARYFATI